MSESVEVSKSIKVGDRVSIRSLSIPNDDFSKDSPFIAEYLKDAYYVVESIKGNYIYCRIDANWSKSTELKKINKSNVSYVVRNGKIIAADHPSFE